ncbi:MAG: diphosphomevalonate decarboxylase [Flavobacteriales bacterium]|nr:diphosphomevalonate decarboxylase [Flavobacteriales bacterium]
MEKVNGIEIMTSVKWKCPSNIAIVKYWGKKANQIPCNSSLSLTLAHACTETEVSLSAKSSDGVIELDYFFEGSKNEMFGARVEKYLAANIESFPFLRENALTIQSSNNFPHSAGIASSASAFGAIALALLDLRYQDAERPSQEIFLREASHIARLASGSACRSIFPDYALWGENARVPNSSNLHAIPVTEIHEEFEGMNDTILVIEDEPKKVSSSAGHSLMQEHPYAFERFRQANDRVRYLVDILKNGDISAFIEICESEALTLHAMMMTSKNYYLLMKAHTIDVIEKIFDFRSETKIPVAFTLDAGPNVHLLYPKKYRESVQEFVQMELAEMCKGVIHDHAGRGPMKMNN